MSQNECPLDLGGEVADAIRSYEEALRKRGLMSLALFIAQAPPGGSFQEGEGVRLHLSWNPDLTQPVNKTHLQNLRIALTDMLTRRRAKEVS